MLKEETEALHGDDSLEGFAIDLIRHLSLELGFNYTFILEEDAEYGKKLPDESWDGMIGRLIRGVICDVVYIYKMEKLKYVKVTH